MKSDKTTVKTPPNPMWSTGSSSLLHRFSAELLLWQKGGQDPFIQIRSSSNTQSTAMAFRFWKRRIESIVQTCFCWPFQSSEFSECLSKLKTSTRFLVQFLLYYFHASHIAIITKTIWNYVNDTSVDLTRNFISNQSIQSDSIWFNQL